jgi:hypothetical protein
MTMAERSGYSGRASRAMPLDGGRSSKRSICRATSIGVGNRVPIPLNRLLATRARGREQMCLALRRLDASPRDAVLSQPFVGGRKLSRRVALPGPNWLSWRSGLWSRQGPLLALVACERGASRFDRIFHTV